MKILHLSHGYLPENTGGVESYLQVMLTAQRAAGIDASLLCGSLEPWPEPGIESLEHAGIPLRRLHRDDLYFDLHAKAWHPGVEGLLDELFAREKPDLIHVHQWIRLTSNLVEIAARHAIPAVVTLHDLYTSCARAFRVRPDGEACFRPLSIASCLDCVPRFGHESDRELRLGIDLFRDQYQAELALAARVLVADPATADLIAETTGCPRDRFHLLRLAYEPRFHDPETGAPPAPAALPSDDEPFRFAYWGNLTQRKGAQVLLRAFRELISTGPPRPAELHLFGRVDTEALETELHETATDLPVIFHGRYDYADLLSARAHMAIFPMLCFETWGFVLDECFELGLPCIVTDIGALARRAGDAALRVPLNDPGAMAAAMRAVLERPALRDELRARIPPPPPSPAEHLRSLIAICEQAISESNPDAPPLPAWRRAQLLLLQRESAQARICPEGGPR